jgi:hypothetical protein
MSNWYQEALDILSTMGKQYDHPSRNSAKPCKQKGRIDSRTMPRLSSTSLVECQLLAIFTLFYFRSSSPEAIT